MPLKTLNPPILRRLARLAALARLKEIQAVSAELLKIRMELEELQSAKVAPPEIAKRGKKKA